MPGLSVLSNRSASAADLKTIASTAGETHGLSNSHFGDSSWPKVVQGEKLLEQAIKKNASARGNEDELIESLFEILSIDKLRQREPGEEWDVYVRQMRNSILIPPLKGQAFPAAEGGGKESAAEHLRVGVNGTSTPRQGEADGVSAGTSPAVGYGTQKQTVVLVNRAGHVTFVERTLYDEKGSSVLDGEGMRRFEFDIEGWTR